MYGLPLDAYPCRGAGLKEMKQENILAAAVKEFEAKTQSLSAV
jgi:hypothetical protein